MLSTLRRIVQEVAAAPGLHAALDIIVRRVHQALGVDACAVYLTQLDDGPQRLILRAGHGVNPDVIGQLTLTPEQGLVGLVAQRAEPLNLERASSHPRYLKTAAYGDREFETFLGVPIIHQSRVLGVMVVAQEQGRRFGEDVVTFLVTLAAQLAASIMHAVVGEEAFQVQSGQAGSAGIVKGLSGALGVGIGECVVAYSPAALDDIPNRRAPDPEREMARLRQAIEATKEDIRNLSEEMRNVLPEEERALFDVYILMLDGDSLWEEAERVVRDDGLWAPAGLRETIKRHVRHFQEMADPYLAERASDVRDLGRRILMKLTVEGDEGPREYPQRTILVGNEVSAAQIAEVPQERLAGIVSMRGSGSSHVAILARALGIPTVMGANDLPIARLEGKELIVDGYLGWVFVQPDEDIKEEFVRLAREEQELNEQLQGLKEEDTVTLDGQRIYLFANTGLQAEISPALIDVADGLGLYRTEMPFQIRDRFPGEEEQVQIYRRPLEAFAPAPCILRTLDIGGDKMLPYFSVEEDNPFLGWRGIRVTLDHPEIFLTQVRAMLRANEGLGNLSIMLPMISRLEELQQSMALIQRAHRELLDDGLDTPLPEVGVMIEVPAAVYQIEAIAKRVDFISVGTNDLTQYLLAVDRNNERVAKMYDSLHPAVLRALVEIKRGAARHGKPVSICGEFAGDPLGAVLLIGMGIDSLSMSAGALLRIKWVVRSFSHQHAREILERAIEMEDGRSVRQMMIDELDKAGIGGLIRAGK